MTLREFIEATKDWPLDATLIIKTENLFIERVESIDYYKHRNSILIGNDKEREKSVLRSASNAR